MEKLKKRAWREREMTWDTCVANSLLVRAVCVGRMAVVEWGGLPVSAHHANSAALGSQLHQDSSWGGMLSGGYYSPSRKPPSGCGVSLFFSKRGPEDRQNGLVTPMYDVGKCGDSDIKPRAHKTFLGKGCFLLTRWCQSKYQGELLRANVYWHGLDTWAWEITTLPRLFDSDLTVFPGSVVLHKA